MESLTLKTAPPIGSHARRLPVLHFPALPQSYRKPLPLTSTKLVVFRASCGADSATFGGWDELTPADGSINSGESAQLRKFLASIGFDDKKYVLVFILGLISALAITRVRVSSIIVFPATVLVFGIGFSLGVVRGGSGSETSSNGYSKVRGEKLKALVEFFDGLDARVNHLKSELENSIGFNRVALSDLKNYVEEIDSIRSSALSARDAFVSPATAGSSNAVLTDSFKSNKRKKEIGGGGFRLLDFLFGEKLVDVNKKIEETKDSARGSVVSSNVDEEKMFSSSSSSRFDTADPIPYRNGEKKLRSNPKFGSMDSDEVIGGDRGYSDREEFSYQNDRFQFVNNQRVYMKSSRSYDASRSSFLDNQLDFGGAVKNEASVFEEQVLAKSSGTYRSWQRNEERVNNGYTSRHREKNLLDNQNFELEGDENTSSSVSDDVIFDRYLTEANNLLKQAEEIVKGRYDEERSQAILYKTAEVLSRAVAMKPMSLLAVGKLGNTYLLHGELKLRISRDLRSMLSSNDPFSFDRKIGFLSSLDSNPPSKDKVASALVGVCEECEELLVKAGRNYRLALSIDGSDVRALYNWGLALSFRAQLIADIGPEAAFDADKVFLAAIDKFVAMMSKGNVYAPDALYRWGMTLQQRSYLRPRNSKEKVKLLEQARRLYEDSLDMESDNPRVKEALSSCLSELDYRHF